MKAAMETAASTVKLIFEPDKPNLRKGINLAIAVFAFSLLIFCSYFLISTYVSRQSGQNGFGIISDFGQRRNISANAEDASVYGYKHNNKSMSQTNEKSQFLAWNERGFKPRKSVNYSTIHDYEFGHWKVASNAGTLFFINRKTGQIQHVDPRYQNVHASHCNVNYPNRLKWKYFFLHIGLNASTTAEQEISNILDQYASKNFTLPAHLSLKLQNNHTLNKHEKRFVFDMLQNEIFNPEYSDLFAYRSDKSVGIDFNPAYSNHTGDYYYQALADYAAAGKLLAFAIRHKMQLDFRISRVFYRNLLSEYILLEDVKDDDPEFYHSMLSILTNKNVSDLQLTFSTPSVSGNSIIELISRGGDILVDSSNSYQYVHLMLQHRFKHATMLQLPTFMAGFYSLIRLNDLREISTYDEFGILMSGYKHINVKAWRDNTVYAANSSQEHQVITWFWHLMISFNDAQRAQAMRWMTGNSRVPMDGIFLRIKLVNEPLEMAPYCEKTYIEKTFGETTLFLSSRYPSYEHLKEKLINQIEQLHHEFNQMSHASSLYQIASVSSSSELNDDGDSYDIFEVFEVVDPA